jgi:hypothetical protein
VLQRHDRTGARSRSFREHPLDRERCSAGNRRRYFTGRRESCPRAIGEMRRAPAFRRGQA